MLYHDMHPAIEELIKLIPVKRWNSEKRELWLRTAETLFSLVYFEEEQEVPAPEIPAEVPAVLYKDTGTANTSPLIGLIDTATNLPVTPNGGDIQSPPPIFTEEDVPF